MRTRKIKKQIVHKKGFAEYEKGVPNQCQCIITCSKPALPKRPFCMEHLKVCPKLSVIA